MCFVDTEHCKNRHFLRRPQPDQIANIYTCTLLPAHSKLTPSPANYNLSAWSMIRDSQQTHKQYNSHKTMPDFTQSLSVRCCLLQPSVPVCKIVEISKYWNDNFNLGFKSRQASHVRSDTFHPTPGWKVHFRWGQINPSVIKIQPRSKSWFIIRSDNKSRNFIPSCEPNVILNRPTLDFHKSKQPSALVL